ncbi:hypothetical protein O6H91_02G013300 [Diphasiastrum complanatum]|uniref:Uncharacterized protein n=1 Tax=Diphasiastrum complanatum TaxID=34168 RepID=A0ACC2ECW7_DIPCM|nr:hypothetical protein O6H91_02G013300 [Diphasiastrum complanatum]
MDSPENSSKQMHDGSSQRTVTSDSVLHSTGQKSPKFKWGDLDDEDLKDCQKDLKSLVLPGSSIDESSVGTMSINDKVHNIVSCSEESEKECLHLSIVQEESTAPKDEVQALDNESKSLEGESPECIRRNLDDHNLRDVVEEKSNTAIYAILDVKDISLASNGQKKSVEDASQEAQDDSLAEPNEDGPVLQVEATQSKRGPDLLDGLPHRTTEKASFLHKEERLEAHCKPLVEQTVDPVSTGTEDLGYVMDPDKSTLKEVPQTNTEIPYFAEEAENAREEDSFDISFAANMLRDKLNAGDLGANKERFRQRLWCYLFENLNRAVDELYFLCELECDMDQIREALLVLDEAGVDFKDLKARIKGFNKLKKSPDVTHTLHSANGGSNMSARLEHHRPHAIAWEVRRMASSPRKADILSSSLEAFQKAQQEGSIRDKVHQAKQRNMVQYLSYAQDSKENLPGKATREKEVMIVKDIAARSRIKQPSSTSSAELLRRGSSSEKVQSTVEASRDVPSAGKMQTNPATSAVQDPPKIRENKKVEGRGRVQSQSNINEKNRLSAEPPDTTNRVHRVSSSSVPHSEKVSKSSLYGPERLSLSNKEKERKLPSTRSALEAWKEKRNWEDILSSPLRTSSRTSRSPMTGRKSTERARVLHDKLMSPERKKKSPLEMKKEVDEKHARATRIRRELETERAQRLQRTAQKLNRVSEWQAVRSTKLREGMHARQQRVESRHEAHLAEIARRASDESSKVSEVRFITSLNEENKKLSLQQKLQDSEVRRAERLQTIRIKQKEDVAREEAALERRKLLEAERLQKIAETQRKKDEAQARREEERRAASAAREARAVEQVRKKEVRAKAQQEEVELLRQRLAERLRESASRRNVYLEQIRERAVMENRDQASPLSRRSSNKEMPIKAFSGQSMDYELALEKESSVKVATAVKPSAGSSAVNSVLITDTSLTQSQSSKKRIKKIRQRLTTQKFEFVEPPVGVEGAGIGPASVTGAAKSKIGRWMQDLQRCQQARKAGSSAAGLVIGEMVKYLEGKEVELHAARQAGLLDFVATALQASHTSKPEASQVTISLLRILIVLLALPANRSYFLARNLLPPLIPILATALENFSSVGYSNIGVSVTVTSNGAHKEGSVEKSVGDEKLEAVREVLEGLLKCVTSILGHTCYEQRHLQMQDDLAELIVACETVHRLQNLFSLFDRPQMEGAPIPPPVLLGLQLLETLTGPRGKVLAAIHDAPLNILPQIIQPQNATLKNEPVMCDISSSVSGCIDQASSAAAVIVGPKLQTFTEGLKSMDDENMPGRIDEKGEKSTIVTESKEGALVSTLNSGTDCIAAETYSKGENGERKVESGISGDTEVAEESPKIPESDIGLQSLDLSIRDETRYLHERKSTGFLLSAIAETGLVGLPSLLTAVLLQANPRASPEQAACSLPSNFEEVATSVLRVLNNIARLDLPLVQNMLEMPDLRMEFFHLVSFLLSYCTCKWKSAFDQVASLLLESLLLLGYFGLLHSDNQAVLRWGKTPTILQK